MGQIRRDVMQGLLGGIGDGVILTDCDERVSYANRAALKILRLDELKEGMYFDEICPLVNVKTGEPYASPLKRAIEKDRSVGLARNIGILYQGSPVFLSFTCSPMRDEWGGIAGCSIIMRDITRMRRLEMKIENDHHYLRSIFAAASIGLCVLDTSGRIMDVNEAGAEIMGTHYKEALQLQFGDALHCENSLMHGCGHSGNCRHCPVRKNLEAAIMDDEYANDFTVCLKSAKSGEPVWLKIFVSQTWTETGKQIIVAIIDESARKEREQALEKARAAAEAIAKAKDQFMANMSHEIRTPINGLNGMIDLTLRTELTPEQRENLVSARQCSEDLLSIINDILDFSKLESGRMKIEKITLDFHELLRQICAVQGAAANNKGLEFVPPKIDLLPRYIHGDPLRMRQMLNNLLNNAIKFTPQGKVTLEVRVDNGNGEPSLIMSVRDTGIGIDSQNRHKLFQPFSQVDGSITRRFGGTGLGLMIVKQLAEAMGGKIEVESELGVGSAFCLQLPLDIAEAPKETTKGDRVFMNPARRILPERSGKPEPSFDILADDPDLAQLLDYCEQKLNGGN